jgi:hypothetical protein
LSQPPHQVVQFEGPHELALLGLAGGDVDGHLGPIL